MKVFLFMQKLMASFIYKNILASPAFSLLSAYSMVIKGDLICKIDAIYNYCTMKGGVGVSLVFL